MKTLILSVGVILLIASSYSIGVKVEHSRIITDSLTTHTDKYVIDLPYRLDTSGENILARRVGDTIYVYHSPK
jgi:hypothetical protein